jgi:hypothetical protein
MDVMLERVVDSSDDQSALLLVVSLRAMRDPVLALDVTLEAIATLPRETDDVAALVCLEGVIAAARRDGRIGSVERRRRTSALEITTIDAALLAELHALGRATLARGAEPLALTDDVVSTAHRIEREAPSLEQLRAIAPSGLVEPPETEVGDRAGH